MACRPRNQHVDLDLQTIVTIRHVVGRLGNRFVSTCRPIPWTIMTGQPVMPTLQSTAIIVNQHALTCSHGIRIVVIGWHGIWSIQSSWQYWVARCYNLSRWVDRPLRYDYTSCLDWFTLRPTGRVHYLSRSILVLVYPRGKLGWHRGGGGGDFDLAVHLWMGPNWSHKSYLNKEEWHYNMDCICLDAMDVTGILFNAINDINTWGLKSIYLNIFVISFDFVRTIVLLLNYGST